MDDGVEPVLVIGDAQHQRRDQFFEDPSVAPVLQAVDDLLADARVPQGGPGALEVEVHALTRVTQTRVSKADGIPHRAQKGRPISGSASEHVRQSRSLARRSQPTQGCG